jgi:hypothetical protein
MLATAAAEALCHEPWAAPQRAQNHSNSEMPTPICVLRTL